MAMPESTIKLPNLSYFNILDFFRGITVVGLMVVLSMALRGFKGIGGELSWLPMTGAVFLLIGTFVLYNSDSSVLLYLQRGIIQSHFVFMGKVFSRTIASKNQVEAVVVDFMFKYEPESKAIVQAAKIYFYPVFLLDKTGKKEYLDFCKSLEEAEKLAQQIADGWKIKVFPGREKSFAIISKGPNNTFTITYSSNEPVSAADKIPSSIFWLVSFTVIIFMVMFVLYFLKN